MCATRLSCRVTLPELRAPSVPGQVDKFVQFCRQWRAAEFGAALPPGVRGVCKTCRPCVEALCNFPLNLCVPLFGTALFRRALNLGLCYISGSIPEYISQLSRLRFVGGVVDVCATVQRGGLMSSGPLADLC